MRDYYSELDVIVDRIAGIIAEGLSSLEAFDEICGAGAGEIIVKTRTLLKKFSRIFTDGSTIPTNFFLKEKLSFSPTSGFPKLFRVTKNLSGVSQGAASRLTFG